MIQVNNISGGYHKLPIIKDMSFHVEQGELFGIIGPNGSGKTTLLKMLSQILPTQAGEIMIDTKPVLSYDTKDFARLVAVLPQNTMQTFSYTVRETVTLGRYAHQHGIFNTLTHEDEQIINEVMIQTGIKSYEHDLIDHLSGGERQRVFLAQALAQDPKILLLDEPTNHLDLAYQKELLEVLKSWTRERKITVVAIFHDLNLAGLYCDRLLLMNEGMSDICGAPHDVLKKDRIEDVYDTDIVHHPHPKVPRPQMMLVPSSNVDFHELFIDDRLLQITNEMITLEVEQPLKTMSSGITGSGVGWHRFFVNRQVPGDYDCTDYESEMKNYLMEHGFHPDETVSMMTAVNLMDLSFTFLEADDLSVFIVVTAAAGNAVDASFGKTVSNRFSPGTVNMWIFINGELTDQAFIQVIATATEAKAKAMDRMNVKDAYTETIATGTPTDSILVAGTQQGQKLDFAGTATMLGQLVGKGVYYCITKSLKKYFARYKG